jgi:hypothetical protein
MSEQPADYANPFAKCEAGTETGEYINDDGLPRVWDGEKWLQPKEALEAGIIDKFSVMEELADEDLGDLKEVGGTYWLWKIPGYFVLDLADSDYAYGRKNLEFFENLEEARTEFWNAIKETVESGEVRPESIGKKVHSRSVYSEDSSGGFWETAEVYDCSGFAVIDYGTFPGTCNVPQLEFHYEVSMAKNTLESFVDELERNAQGNIGYKWRTTVWNEGEEEVEQGASWQDDEDEEEVDSDEDKDDQDEDDESDAAGDESEEDDDLTPEAK